YRVRAPSGGYRVASSELRARPKTRRPLHEHLIHIAPTPVFARLEGLDDGMLDLMKMLGGMPILRRIAAPDVSAFQAQAQMHPGIAHLQAFLAAFAAGSDFLDLFQMSTVFCHKSSQGCRRCDQFGCSSRNRSASIAAMQP